MITGLNGPAALQIHDVDDPVRAAGEVLVEVKAVAPAFPDLLMSKGEYQVKPELPFSRVRTSPGLFSTAPPTPSSAQVPVSPAA